jgi:hypothetical protein
MSSGAQPRPSVVALSRPSSPAPTTSTRLPTDGSAVGSVPVPPSPAKARHGRDRSRRAPACPHAAPAGTACSKRRRPVPSSWPTRKLLDRSLAEDLGLTDDHRVEPGRRPEEVRDRGLVVVDVEMGQQRVGGDSRTVRRQAGRSSTSRGNGRPRRRPPAGCRWRSRGLGDVRSGQHIGDQFDQAVGDRGRAARAPRRGGLVRDAHDRTLTRRTSAEDPDRRLTLRCSW